MFSDTSTAEVSALNAIPARELEQAILNVLRNAIDASPEGGGVVVNCRRDDDRILLEVTDQGLGVGLFDTQVQCDVI